MGLGQSAVTTAQGISLPLLRAYLRPYVLYSRPRNSTDLGAATIEIQNASGGVMGRLRTDAEKSILKELTFQHNENGVADFNMQLSEYPPFRIVSGSLIKIKIYDTDDYWYTGEINYTPEQGNRQDVYEYKGLSPIEHLERLRSVTATYSGTLDVGAVVKHLVINSVIPYCSITYNPSKIDTVTGVALVSDIEISQAPLKKVFEILAEMAGAEWGVDGNGDFFFEVIDADSLAETIFVGYDVQDFEPEYNYDEIVNAIIVQRQQQAGSGESGWSGVDVFNDETSQAKHKIREEVVQVPGWMSDDDCTILGNALLAAKKDPQLSGKMTGYLASKFKRLMPRGTYRFINQLDTYFEVHDECEDYMDWAVSGSGDLALSDESSIIFTGAKALKADFQYASGQVLYLLKTFDQGRINKVRFYIQTNKAGLNLTFGLGVSTWSEWSQMFSLSITGKYLPIEFDLSGQGFSEINYLGFQVEDDYSQNVRVYIDSIEFEITGNKTYRMRLAKHSYMYRPGNTTVSAEFGIPRPGLHDYVAGLKSASTELKFVTEKR